MDPSIKYCKTVGQVVAAMKELFPCKDLYVDMEGVNLGRNGLPCLLQIMGDKTSVYVFDLLVLGGIPECVRQLLESPEWRKFTWDPRADSDSLYNCCGRVMLSNVLCLQLAEIAHDRYHGRTRNHVTGLAKAMSRFLPEDLSAVTVPIKQLGKAMFAPGGNPAVFAQRPLGEYLINYCSLDVAVLPFFKKCLWDPLPEKWQLWTAVKTHERVCLAFSEEGLSTGRAATVAPEF